MLTILIAASTSLAQPSLLQQATNAFNSAQQADKVLNEKPSSEQTRADVLKVINSYQRVYLLTPKTSYADDSLLAIARLYESINDNRNAIKTLKFLVNEYPQSPFKKSAERDIASLNAGDEAVPVTTEAVVETKDLRESKDPKEFKTVARVETKPGDKVTVDNIRYWPAEKSLRVVVDLSGEVRFKQGEAKSPNRVYIDIANAHLNPTLVAKEWPVESSLLQKIRVGQFDTGTVRVVLDVGTMLRATSFTLRDPDRLIIDVVGDSDTAVPSLVDVAPKRASNETNPVSAPASATPDIPPVTVAAAPAAVTPPSDPKRVIIKTAPATTPAPSTTSAAIPATDTTSRQQPAKPAAVPATDTASRTPPTKPAVTPAAEASARTQPTTSAAVPATDTASRTPAVKPAATPPVITPPAASVTAAATVAPAPATEAKPDKTTDPGPQMASTAKPTSLGNRTLIRSLGLKVTRVVIDAGHGGRDTGSIGPTGYSEKDLVLDVAKRLKALIETEIGAEVVMTRNDDTFVPLETRTVIANQQEADLFISIHANSSRTKTVRGVETFFLNFTNSREALDTAARENAGSDKSVHELSDLVKQIVLTEKVTESRELAQRVQAAMSKAKGTGPDRGVKQAPFVVLIGANMPSILAEVSFISNPDEEKVLRTPAYRQHIAESLLDGVRSYADTLSGIKTASSIEKD